MKCCISQYPGRKQMAQMVRQQELIDKVNEKTIHNTTESVKKTNDSSDDPLARGGFRWDRIHGGRFVLQGLAESLQTRLSHAQQRGMGRKGSTLLRSMPSLAAFIKEAKTRRHCPWR